MKSTVLSLWYIGLLVWANVCIGAENSPIDIPPETVALAPAKEASRSPASTTPDVVTCLPTTRKCELWNSGVALYTRELNSRMVGKVGAHSWIQVVENGKVFAVGGTDRNGKLVVQTYEGSFVQRKGEGTDDTYSGFGQIAIGVISPPNGVSQAEWNQRFISAGKAIQKEISTKLNFDLGGGDDGKTSGNCHTITKKIIEKAQPGLSREILPDFHPKGLHPGWTYVIKTGIR